MSLRGTSAAIVGPALAGVCIAAFGAPILRCGVRALHGAPLYGARRVSRVRASVEWLFYNAAQNFES